MCNTFKIKHKKKCKFKSHVCNIVMRLEMNSVLRRGSYPCPSRLVLLMTAYARTCDSRESTNSSGHRANSSVRSIENTALTRTLADNVGASARSSGFRSSDI